MRVIKFPWRTWVFTDEGNVNLIRKWIIEERIPASIVALLQLYVDLIRADGPAPIRALGGIVTLSSEEGIYAIRANKKSVTEAYLIFCEGPQSDTEVTLLAGAPVTIQGGSLGLDEMLVVARQNLHTLNQNPRARRKLESLT